jgi:hypothetical protein
MRTLLVLAIALLPTAALAQAKLADIPFWKLMEGWWRAENTYMDGKLDYNIRSYNSIIHVKLDGDTVTETEYKFYPPSKLALEYGKGQTTADEGIETVSVSVGRLRDAQGTVDLSREQSKVTVLGPDSAVRVTANDKTNVDTYRMYIVAMTPDKRYRSNFGIVSDISGAGAANALPGAELGDLRGFSLFRETRIQPSDFEKLRQDFRVKNNVHAVVETGSDGKPTIRRLD